MNARPHAKTFPKQFPYSKKPMQPELNLLYPLADAKPTHEPKVEPHRVNLDAACATVFILVRRAIETPSGANLCALRDAVIQANQRLMLLQYVETEMALPVERYEQI